MAEPTTYIAATGATWGLFRLPDKLAPGELKWVKNAHALPRTWRGFVSEHTTSDEAHEAWNAGMFVRQIVDDPPWETPYA